MKVNLRRLSLMATGFFVAMMLIAMVVEMRATAPLQPPPSRDGLRDVASYLEQSGLGPDLSFHLETAVKQNPDWAAVYVAERPAELNHAMALFDQEVLAAYPAELLNLTTGDALSPLRTDWRHGLGSSPIASAIPSADGKVYDVWVAQLIPMSLWGTIAHDAAWVALLLAWLSLALWLFLDVRAHRSAAAPAWLLLGLASGPVAVAVWLITCHARQAPAAEPCPGCGADTISDAAFCVRCGHALRPACPDCRRPVAVDWANCAACGSSLTE